MRSVARDAATLQTAIYSFRDKYFLLPGDINNASQFWGCTDCNGNGDGLIANHGVDTAINTNRYEDSVVLLHMASAGLITGTYTGDYDSTATRRINSADNAFPSKIGRAVFAIARPDIWGATSGLRGRNAICLSTVNRGAVCAGPQSASYDLHAEDAWNIDSKIDDGSMRNGRLIADSCMIDSNHWGFDDQVIYRSAITTYEYDLTDSSTSCGLMFIL